MRVEKTLQLDSVALASGRLQSGDQVVVERSAEELQCFRQSQHGCSKRLPFDRRVDWNIIATNSPMKEPKQGHGK